jgi:hypothetical protein
MRWKVHLKGNGEFFFLGERKLSKFGSSEDIIGFYLVNVEVDGQSDHKLDHPVYIPWNSVLYIEEIP